MPSPPGSDSPAGPETPNRQTAAGTGERADGAGRNRYAVPLGVVLAALALGAWVESLPDETARALTAETGPVEIASAVFFGMAALLAGFHLSQQPSVLRLAAGAMLVWAFLRELDFQKRFTYRSIMSTGYYTRPYAPWEEKLLVLLILSPFVLAGCYLVWQLIRNLRPAIARREPWTVCFAAGLGLGVIGGAQEKLLRWGAAEEVSGAGLALLALLLVWELRPRTAAPTPAQT